MMGAGPVTTRRAAGADWAFVSDASALVIAEELEPASSDVPLPLIRVASVDELRNISGPRDPVDVARSFAAKLRAAGIDSLASDGHYRASWQPVLADAGIDWIPAPVKQDGIASTFLWLRVLLHSDRLDLPPLPRLRAQLDDLVAHAGAGTLAVKTKRRKEEGGGTSHGDIVSALVLALWQLTRASGDYRHAGVPARGAASDPRTRGAHVSESFAGIPRGEFEEYAPSD